MRRIKDYGPSLIVLATTATVLLAGPHAVRRLSYAYTDARIIEASQRLDDNPILEQVSQAYRDLAVMVEPSVVHVSTEQAVRDDFGRRARRASSGSGWVYDDQGHIVTNHHVIENADRIEVQMHDGHTHSAEIVGSDPLTDIAVLKIDNTDLHPALRRMRLDGSIEQGELVFAFGSPFDFRFSMSSGVVSGKGRSVNVIRDGNQAGFEYFIQVDAAINPGNSGGPLTDSRGRVIGMNTAIATGRRSPGLEDGQFAGIGLAIPIEMIVPAVSQLIEHGMVEKGYLGLKVVDRDNLLGEEFEIQRVTGLLVAEIDPEHPAYAEGLRVGDLLTSIDGSRLTSRRQILGMVSDLDDDDTVTLAAQRLGRTAGASESRRYEVPARSMRGLRGLALLQANDQVGELFDALGYAAMGVRVASLEDGGPALQSGLRRGDIITHVNGQPMLTVNQLRSVISSMLPGDVAKVSVWRFRPQRNDAETVEVEVPLGRLAEVSQRPFTRPSRRESLPDLGIREMRTSSRDLARRFETEFHPGVMLLLVDPDSRLGREDIPRGSIIVDVMERPVESVEELLRELQRHELDAPYGASVTIRTPDGRMRQVRLQRAAE